MQPATPHKKTYAFDYDSVFSEVRERIEILGLIDYQHRATEADIEDAMSRIGAAFDAISAEATTVPAVD